MMKRFVSMLLVLCIVLTLLPAQGFAVESKPNAVTNAAADNPFSDIKEGQWYYDTVLYAYRNGLFREPAPPHFLPAAP